jgi:hypothetical protein
VPSGHLNLASLARRNVLQVAHLAVVVKGPLLNSTTKSTNLPGMENPMSLAGLPTWKSPTERGLVVLFLVALGGPLPSPPFKPIAAVVGTKISTLEMMVKRKKRTTMRRMRLTLMPT